jgi:hypothetical protein
VQLNSDGISPASSGQPIASMRRGATVSGFPVGDIIDIAFDDNLNRIVALDSSGVLVRCPPRFIIDCDAHRILASENWVEPNRISVWQGRLYVLDTAGQQLWRYQTAGGTYPSMPTEVFAGQVRPDLSEVVSFDINTNGSICIMSANGVLETFFGGEPEAFGFSGFPEGQELVNTTIQNMFLNDSPILTGFYIASRAKRTIYTTTLSGTFMESYRVFDEDKLALFSGVTADPAQQIIYVTSGNSIFAIQK